MRMNTRVIIILILSVSTNIISTKGNSPSSHSSHNKHQERNSKAYPLGCSNKSPSYYDYDNYNPLLSSSSPSSSSSNEILKQYNHHNFIITKKLGSGKFSDVYEALMNNKEKVAIKCLKPVSFKKIKRELLILKHVSTLPNLVRFLGILCITPPDDDDDENITLSTLFNDYQQVPAFVLQHAGLDSHWFCHGSTTNDKEDDEYYLSMYEIKYYLYNLLLALDALHSSGIMHRDVKPRNILITRTHHNTQHEKNLVLVDLGLADFYSPHKYYNVRVASRHYKAPELLINYPYYDYAIDMWSVGCILASLLFRMKEPFFKGNTNIEQFYTIVSILGIDDFLVYYTRYLKGKVLMKHPEDGVDYPTYELDEAIHHTIMHKKHYSLLLLPKKRKSWMKLYLERVQQSNNDILEYDTNNCNNTKIQTLTNTKELKKGFDLLDKLLIYNHFKRFTAKEAMLHSFFDDVRNEIESRQINCDDI